MADFERLFANLLRARFPFIYLSTWEEDRALDTMRRVVADEKLIKTKRQVYVWTLTGGLGQDGAPGKADSQEPLRALDMIEKVNEPALFVLKDFHVFFGGQGRQSHPAVIRKIRDLAPALRFAVRPKNVVFLCPTLVLPDELQKEITVLDFDLPTFGEINQMLGKLIEDNRNTGIRISLPPGAQERLAKAAQGLTLLEAENAFARTMAQNNSLDINGLKVILEEKRQIIKKSETLEFVEVELGLGDVGGLGNLKRWLRKRDKSWLESARRYALPAPRGILITGVPGCGKSLIAKAISASWQLPLLRMDIGKVFSGLVGSSEENIRRNIRTAEALAPAVLWIDEIEKGFSATNSWGDSGTAARVFATFLTWMQEKAKPVFVVATANNIEALPPEFLRKGRFDEIFFVDLPTQQERMQIFRIHLCRRLTESDILGDVQLTDETYDRLAHATEGFIGAEIEQAVISGLFEAFAEDRKVDLADFTRAIQQTVPLSLTQAEQIQRIRQWADRRAVAATAQQDRSGYEDATTADADTPGNPEEDVMRRRGGRQVDFG